MPGRLRQHGCACPGWVTLAPGQPGASLGGCQALSVTHVCRPWCGSAKLNALIRAQKTKAQWLWGWGWLQLQGSGHRKAVSAGKAQWGEAQERRGRERPRNGRPRDARGGGLRDADRKVARCGGAHLCFQGSGGRGRGLQWIQGQASRTTWRYVSPVYLSPFTGPSRARQAPQEDILDCLFRLHCF